MNYTTLISATELQALLAQKQPVRVFDCSFDLSRPQAGREQFLQSHIPGAVYADLDRDLSARHGVPGSHGVHDRDRRRRTRLRRAAPASEPREVCGMALKRGVCQ